MGDVDDTKDERTEASKIILSLLRVLLEDASQEQLQWLHQSHEVDQSEDLKVVELEALIEEHQLWHSSDHVKQEVAAEIIHGDGLDLLQSSGPLHEIENDLEQVNDINSSLNILQGLLMWRIRVGIVGSVLPSILIDVVEDNNKRRHKHTINGEDGNEEVPHLAECALSVD
jgi:hypothetical protein